MNMHIEQNDLDQKRSQSWKQAELHGKFCRQEK